MSSKFEYLITGDDSANNPYGATYVAQTFTPQLSHTIKSVKLLLYRQGNPGTIAVSIRATSSGKPTGSDLCSGTLNGNTIETSATWYEITLGAGIDLVAGTMYAIVVGAPSGSSGNVLFWRRKGTSTLYPRGTDATGLNNGLGPWTAYLNDYMFEEWGILKDLEVFGGSLTPVGTLTLKKTIHLSLSGNLTPTGHATVPKHNFASLSGALGMAGAVTLRNPDWMVLDKGYNWRGNWSVVVDYAVGDAVLYQDGGYIHAFESIASHNTGHLPTDAAYWKRIFQAKWRG
jgi:hypothetical protein